MKKKLIINLHKWTTLAISMPFYEQIIQHSILCLIAERKLQFWFIWNFKYFNSHLHINIKYSNWFVNCVYQSSEGMLQSIYIAIEIHAVRIYTLCRYDTIYGLVYQWLHREYFIGYCANISCLICLQIMTTHTSLHHTSLQY